MNKDMEFRPESPCGDAQERSQETQHSGGRPRFYWGSFLHEHHERGCTCSYCGGFGPGFRGRLNYGLNIPPAWRSPTAWWVVKYGPRRYLRWTRPRFIRPFVAAPKASPYGADAAGGSTGRNNT